MNTPVRPFRFGWIMASSLSGLILAASAPGQTWDGGGADDNWTTINNWNPNALPANNGTAAIIFAGGVRLTPSVNVAQDILSLTFDNTAGAFTLGGANTLTLRAGGITNNDAGTETINAPIACAATQQWNAASGPLAFGGATISLANGTNLTVTGGFPTTISNAISGANAMLSKNGAGVLTVSGALTYGGATQINGGTLRWGASNIHSDTSALSIQGTATLDMNGFTDTIGFLTGFGTTAVISLPGASSLTVIQSNAQLYTAIITGASTATFIKSGPQTLTFTGVHTFPGTYRINAGQITLNASELLDNSADLILDGSTSSLLLAGAFTETVDIVTLMNSASFGGTSGTLIGSAYNFESGGISPHLGGPAALTKTTAGDVQLSNTNTYTGGTVINAGSLTLVVNNALPSTGAVTVNSGGTLVVNAITNTIGALSGAGNVAMSSVASALTIGGGNANSAFSGVISGPGSLSKTGTGTLTLSGANSYTGATTLFAGTLALGASNVLPDATTVQFSPPGGTLDMANFSDTINGLSGAINVTLGTGTLSVGSAGASATHSGVISGTGGLTKVGSGAQTLSGANSYTGTTTVSAGSLRIGANERLFDTSALTVNGGTFDLQSFNETVGDVVLVSGAINGSGTLTGSTYDVEAGTINAHLGGSAALTKTTSGTVTMMSGSNTYTGATNVNAGTLALGAFFTLPFNTADVTVAGSATLQIFNGTLQNIDDLSGAGDVVFLGNGSLLVGNSDATSTFSGVISGGGSLYKNGAGTFTLSGANTYSGLTVVNSGILRIGASNRLDDSTGLTVGGGTFDLQSFNETVAGVTLIGGSITGTGTLTASAYDVQSGTIRAPLGGSAALTKSTAGTVTLSAANTYTGGTSVNAGVLEISADANLGASGGGLSLDGGTLRTTSSMTMNRTVTLGAGGGTIETLGITTLVGTIIGTGSLTKTGGGPLIVSVVSQSLAALTIAAGDLDLPVGGSLSVTGTAIVGASSFFSVNGGLIIAGSFVNSGDVELQNNARLVGPVNNSGILEGNGRVTGGLTNNVAGQVRVDANETLHFAGASAHSNAGEFDVIGGEIEFDAALSNAASTGVIFARDAGLRFDGGLTNAGSVALSFGVTDLFGDITNNAAASIVVSGGSDATFFDDVVNNGSIRTSAGSDSVFFGAVSGTGSFPGTGTVFLEGDLRPGASPAQVSFGGDLVLGSACRLVIELGGTVPGTEHDKLVIARGAQLDGTLNVVLINGFSPNSGETFDILTAAPVTGEFSLLQLPPGFGVQYLPDRVRLRAPPCQACDTDCDGFANGRDVQKFVDGLLGGSTFCSTCAGDANSDTTVNANDIPSFVACLLGS